MRQFWRRIHFFRVRYFRYMAMTLSLGPLIMGTVSLVLLWLPPQIGEVYLGILKDRDILGGLLGLGCLIILSLSLFCWHIYQSTPVIDAIYLENPDLKLDRNLQLVQTVKAFGLAYMPLVGLSLGLARLWFVISDSKNHLDGVMDELKPWASVDELTELGSSLARTRADLFVALAVLFGVAAILSTVLIGARTSIYVRRMVLATAIAIAFMASVGPLVSMDWTVRVSWLVGSLAAGGVVLTALVTVLMALSWLSRIISFPLVRVLVVFGFIMAWFGISRNVPTTGNFVEPSETGHSSQTSIKNDTWQIQEQFERWFASRNEKEKQAFHNDRYPVFIIAAQGGGIYAASAAAKFLSSLQDECSNFADHVFAISGVSGGAVGTALFNAVLASSHKSQRAGCIPGGNHDLENQVDRIVLYDHLSPVLFLIVPDTLRKLLPIRPDYNRASALERSFSCALEAVKDNGDPFGPCIGSNQLTEPYRDHWSPNGGSAALIFNTTWVETGFRVAFAPMSLHSISDGTLYAFRDFGKIGEVEDLSLIGAAVVSARFPLIAPAWQIRLNPTQHNSKERLWNFVDGGYADNSGTTTAVEIYNAIAEFIDRRQRSNPEWKVDLRLIILTDAVADPDLARINGAGFIDTLAPVSALLNVRSQLASRAVTQTVERIQRGATPEELSGRIRDSKILLVKLEQRAFPLPLGWKISSIENDLVGLMLGRRTLCIDPNKAATDQRRSSATETVVGNSCVKKRIVEMLSP